MPETQLHVEFDQPQEVFFPGQPIIGRVLLSTSEVYKARAVKIIFEGKAYTDWDDYESVRRVDAEGKTTYDRRRVNYSSTVNYLQNEILLWACRDGSNELAPGQYIWPFSFGIPSNVPPSFEGKYGYIRYSVTAEVDRPWRFDKAKKRCVTVSPLLDLNSMPMALSPIHEQESENIGCCCFKKGYLELKVDIPKTGFVPGEVVPLNLHILNHGSIPVTEARAKIIQTSRYTAARHGHIVTFTGESVMSGPCQETKIEISDVIRLSQGLTVEPGKEYKMDLEVRIPSVTPTINLNCPIISVGYSVQISIDTASTFNSSVDCELPIVIGTVPIRQCLQPAYQPYDPSQPNPYGFIPGVAGPGIGGGVVPVPSSGPCMPGIPNPEIGGGVAPYPVPNAPPAPEKDGSIVIPSAPPISYEDSMYGTDGTQLKSDENEKPFVPKYPVYNGLPVYNPTAPPKE